MILMTIDSHQPSSTASVNTNSQQQIALTKREYCTSEMRIAYPASFVRIFSDAVRI